MKVRGPHVMAGYYKSPEATREVLDENGWLKTGDLGLLDADGFLTLRGRSKTMFLGATGQNVYPEEIEARLNALPFVAESLVVERDHRLHALVYPDLEAADAAHVGHEAILKEMETEPAEAEREAPSLLPGRDDRDRPRGVPEDPDPEDQAIPLRGARRVEAGSGLIRPHEGTTVETRRLTVELGLPGGTVRVEMDVPMGEVPMERLLPALRTTADAFVAYGAELSAAARASPSPARRGAGPAAGSSSPSRHAEARQLATLVEELPEPRRSVVRERFADGPRAGSRRRDSSRRSTATGGWRAPARRSTSASTYFRLGIACPFLEDESCSIYEDRPIACREYLVTSPPAYCAAPTRRDRSSRSRSRRESGPRSRARRTGIPDFDPATCVPLVLAPVWAARNPDARAPRPGPELLQKRLRALLARPPGRGMRAMTVEAGRKLGRYVLSRKIGAGGMAEVWEAFDEGLHRSVAVKVVRDEIAGEAEFRERFIREARLAAQLEHPRILPIYDFGTEAGVTYLVMPLLPGGSLKERISGPMPADEAVEALAAIAAALDHAHGRGVLHRDVKPSNVLVDASGSLLLADFGLAKNTAVSSELTVAGMVVGTPAYMAPEQAIGRPVDARADQYALGIVAFELLTGRTPFRSESPFAILDKHLREAPPPPSSFVPDLPPEVDAVLAKALCQAAAGAFRDLPPDGRGARRRSRRLDAAEALHGGPGRAAPRPDVDRGLRGDAPRRRPRRPRLRRPAHLTSPPRRRRSRSRRPASLRPVDERGRGGDRRRGAPLHRRGGGRRLDALRAEENAGGASRERGGPSDSGAGRGGPDTVSGDGRSRRDSGRRRRRQGTLRPRTTARRG